MVIFNSYVKLPEGIYLHFSHKYEVNVGKNITHLEHLGLDATRVLLRTID